MTPEQRDQVATAARGLELRDILLLDARFDRPMGLDALTWSGEGTQQFSRTSRHFRADEPATADQPPVILIEVALGTRVLASTNDNEEKVVCVIEARYLVTFVLREAVDDAALETFATWNAPHLVWPFWRQHVVDIVHRAQLPPLTVPLLAGNLA